MHGLPYTQIYAIDFEFVAESGAQPVPVCMVARELISNRLIRLWQDELGPEPPFPVDDDTLFVAYYASAEIGCFLALGWPVPTRILDLYTEFRNATNGLPLPGGRGYLSALAEHGIASITKEQKTEDRALVMGGGPWDTDARRRILDYCQTDVDPLGALLERMLPGIRSRPNGLGQALLRGRYMAAVARMERTGVPIDVDMLHHLRTNWGRIKADLVTAIDKDFGVYEGTTFKAGLFAGYLVDNCIDWPRLDRAAWISSRRRSATWPSGIHSWSRSRSYATRSASSGWRSWPYRMAAIARCSARSVRPAAAIPRVLTGSSSGRACGCAA